MASQTDHEPKGRHQTKKATASGWNISDKIGRRPPIIVGALASGLMSFGYLYAISIHSVPLAIVMSLLMWGVVYQGYNAVFPSFYPEMFPTRTRVSQRGSGAERGVRARAQPAHGRGQAGTCHGLNAVGVT